MAEMQDLSRLKAMIHYIVEAAPYRSFGKVKLNKMLWFADRDMYIRTGQTISHDAYLRYPQGPVSKNILEALNELQEEGKLHIRKERVITYEQFFYVSLAEPDISIFNGEEISAIGRAIALIAPLTAEQASSLSHDRVWQIFGPNEEIPMYAVLAADTGELDADELKLALGE